MLAGRLGRMRYVSEYVSQPSAGSEARILRKLSWLCLVKLEVSFSYLPRAFDCTLPLWCPKRGCTAARQAEVNGRA